MNFTVNELSAARLFILARGRGGDAVADDVVALTSLLQEFALQGYIKGLQNAKDAFRASTDATGACHMMSLGTDCNCTLCRIDDLIKHALEQP